MSGSDDRNDRRRGDRGDDGVSGKAFVAGGVVAVLLVWGVLYVSFRVWKSSYAERAAFGASRVADAVAPLAGLSPTGEKSPGQAAWRKGVEDTRAMLVTITASNMLGVSKMAVLGDRVASRVATATPETALDVLADIWDEAEAGGGPLIANRHPRPPWLRPRTLLTPPPGP